MEEKKKMKKSTKIIIIVLSVIAVIILVDIIISANKEDLTEEISGESFLSDMSDTMESQPEGEISEIDDEEIPEITEEERDKLRKFYSDNPLLYYEFDENGQMIQETGEKELMTETEFEEEFLEAINKIRTQSKDIPILGMWTRLDSEGELSEGNYIKFNADGTYERGGKSQTDEVITKGKYIYAVGGKSRINGRNRKSK